MNRLVYVALLFAFFGVATLLFGVSEETKNICLGVAGVFIAGLLALMLETLIEAFLDWCRGR